MRGTSQLTRRGVLLLSWTGILGARTRWNARDSDFWNRKEPSQWSSEEIDRLITKSPWAKEVKASAPLPSGDIGSGGGRTDGATIPGVGGGRIGGMGIPGISIPGMGGRGGQGRGGGQAQFEVIVRWESAKPVLEALKTPLAEVFANHYVISVSGIPNVYALEGMKSRTYLEGKGLHPVQAGVAQQAPSAFTQTFLFGFPNDKLHLSLDDNEVTFVTQVGQSSIRTKFNLKEMIYRDTLAI